MANSGRPPSWQGKSTAIGIKSVLGLRAGILSSLTWKRMVPNKAESRSGQLNPSEVTLQFSLQPVPLSRAMPFCRRSLLLQSLHPLTRKSIRIRGHFYGMFSLRSFWMIKRENPSQTDWRKRRNLLDCVTKNPWKLWVLGTAGFRAQHVSLGYGFSSSLSSASH